MDLIEKYGLYDLDGKLFIVEITGVNSNGDYSVRWMCDGTKSSGISPDKIYNVVEDVTYFILLCLLKYTGEVNIFVITETRMWKVQSTVSF